MDLAGWLLQIVRVASLTQSQEYKLGMAKFTSSPYKMLKRLHNDLGWHEIKRKLEDVYSPIATKAHADSNLYCKQQPDESL